MFKRIVAAAAALVVAGAMAMPAEAAPVEFRICTGSQTGNYFKAGEILAGFMRGIETDAGQIAPKLIVTGGSVQNLDLIYKEQDNAKRCDLAIVQEDALAVFYKSNPKSSIDRLGEVYREHVHLLCNREVVDKNDIGKITDLRGKGVKLAVGPANGGAGQTWESIKIADPKYVPVPVTAHTDIPMLKMIGDGTEVGCGLLTIGLNSNLMRTVVEDYKGTIRLIATNDSDLIGSAKNEKGAPIYKRDLIPTKTYPGIMGGWSDNNEIPTASVAAVVILSNGFVERIGNTAYGKLILAFNKSKPGMAALVAPPK